MSRHVHITIPTLRRTWEAYQALSWKWAGVVNLGLWALLFCVVAVVTR